MPDASTDLFAAIKLHIPSDEERLAAREAAYAFTRDELIDASDIVTRAPGAPAARLNLLSLPAWLAVAQRAQVDHIPARLLATLPAEDFIATFDAPDAPAGERFAAFHDRVLSNVRPDEMIRMEQVAPHEIKFLMSTGAEMSNGTFELADGSGSCLDLHEERFYVTFKELGADTVRAFARPIVAPETIGASHDGTYGRWPVEFRVYVEEGEIAGISNYYPQIALDPGRFAPVVSRVRAAAQSMLDTMEALHLGVGNHALCADRKPNECMTKRPDWMPDAWSDQSFTLDFMLLGTGRIVFLEGGPAGLSAAHPCCFLQEGREIEPDFLHGVAWSDSTEITPLAELD